MKRLISLFLTLFCCSFFLFLKAQSTNLGIKKIVIDPGHGGKDPGTLGQVAINKLKKILYWMFLLC